MPVAWCLLSGRTFGAPPRAAGYFAALVASGLAFYRTLPA